MKIFKLIFVLLYSVFFILNFSNCYEETESLIKRFLISSQVSKYSNNKIKLNVNQNEGISCKSNDIIEKNQKLVTVPKNYSICSYFLFPFKYEILSFMLDIPDLKDTLKSLESSQKVSFYLLSYHLLYFMYAPKEEIKRYIQQKKLAQYYNCHEINEILKDYFPKEIPGSGLLEKGHYELLKNLGYKLPDEDTLDKVFNHIKAKILISEHKDLLHSWTNNLKHFKWAFTMVVSRAITIKFNKYLKLEGLDMLDTVNTAQNLDASTKKNYEVNKLISPAESGGPCLIPFIDLFNHYQPKFSDSRDRRSLNIETEKGNFVSLAAHYYLPNEEISNTYKSDPTNILLFLNYGFVLPNNIFNSFKINVKDSFVLTNSQFLLCKELKCVDVRLSDPRQLNRVYEVKLDYFDDSLLNYGRVLYLNPDFDKNSVLRTFAKKGKFSVENDIKAWIYYFKSFYNFDRNMSDLILNSIKECQKCRNILSSIENYWMNNASKMTEFNKLKTFENIYLLDISYKKIVIRHMLGGINQVVSNLNKEIENIRIKYIS